MVNESVRTGDAGELEPLWRVGKAPNPSEALFIGAGAQQTSYRWTEMSRRRSMVLAAARRLMSERGINGVSLKSLSSECDMSVQTIYNLVGNRAQVLDSCAEEYTRAMISRTNRQGVYLPLGHTEAMWDFAAQFPDFCLQLVAAYWAPQSSIYTSLNKICLAALRGALRDLDKNARLRGHIQMEDAATVLTQMCAATIHEWAATHRDLNKLKRNLVNGQATFLLGIVTREEAVVIEDNLHKICTDGSTQPSIS